VFSCMQHALHIHISCVKYPGQHHDTVPMQRMSNGLRRSAARSHELETINCLNHPVTRNRKQAAEAAGQEIYEIAEHASSCRVHVEHCRRATLCQRHSEMVGLLHKAIAAVLQPQTTSGLWLLSDCGLQWGLVFVFELPLEGR